VGFRVAVGRFDDQGDVGTSQPRHIEFQVNAAITRRLGGKFVGFGGTVNACGHAGVLDGSAILLVADGDVERSPFAGQPGFRVAQLEEQRFWRSGFVFLRQCQMEGAGANVFDDVAMLLVEAQLQGLFAIGVQGEEVEIIVGTAVQHASAEINRGVNQGVGDATIFRLDVIGRAAYRHVGVVTEKHFPLRFGLRRPETSLTGFFPAHLTDWRVNRYYNASPMSDSGLHTYTPLLIHLLLALGLAGALTAVSVLIGWRRPSQAKQQPYECGMEPTGDARQPFSVKFYLVAMVFILFDVEAIFLYPWAYIFRSLRWYGFVEMMIYIAILLVGYLYLWKKGALDWHK